MSVDFGKFDKTVDLTGLQKDIDAAADQGDFPTIPKGKYEVKVASLELKLTKKEPARPMVAVQFKILSGEYKGQNIFFNRVIYGTKNDASMIKGVLTFLTKLEAPGVTISFDGYDQFAQLLLDVHEAIDGVQEYAIDYDPDAFNSVTITEIFDADDGEE